MITPTIHLNGTGAASLLDTLYAAREKLEDAAVALDKTRPNARDYYPQGDGVISAAIEEHKSRVERIRSVGDELFELTTSIHEQISFTRF